MLVSETREKMGRLIVGIVFKVSFTPFESSLRYIFLSPVLTLTLVSSLVPSLFQCYPRKILSTLPNEIYFFPLFLNFRFYSFVDSPSRFLVSGMVTGAKILGKLLQTTSRADRYNYESTNLSPPFFFYEKNTKEYRWIFNTCFPTLSLGRRVTRLWNEWKKRKEKETAVFSRSRIDIAWLFGRPAAAERDRHSIHATGSLVRH